MAGSILGWIWTVCEYSVAVLCTVIGILFIGWLLHVLSDAFRILVFGKIRGRIYDRTGNKFKRTSELLDGRSLSEAQIQEFLELVPPRYRPRPPRHAALKVGINGDLLTQEITDFIQHAERLLRMSSSYERWPGISREVAYIGDAIHSRIATHLVTPLTKRKEHPHRQFSALESIYALELTNRGARRALMICAIDYLEDLRNRMPDYMKASGQVPGGDSINIVGSTIHGSVAVRLQAINSTISGIVQQGNENTGSALKALEHAVVGEKSIDDDLRNELLENLETLTEEAAKKPADRKRGMLKAIMNSFKSAAVNGPEIAKALEGWGQVLDGLTS